MKNLNIENQGQDTKEIQKTKINFMFHPYQFVDGNHAIEKAEKEGSKLRKYLVGITSGIDTDQHNERMTKECIKSFIEQANSGNLLLYPDVHGIRQSEDIGILMKGEILENHDWKTEYRLYDEEDDVGPVKLEKIDTIWKQLKGLPPYTHPIQKGFSIEGIIPDDGILSSEKDAMGNLSNRIINKVILDGVVLVPRPAYQHSIAHSIYKALGELSPWKIEKIQKGISNKLSEVINGKNIENLYYKKKYEINDALEEIIEEIMSGKELEKKKQLEIAFDEYKKLMTELLLQSESIFQLEGGFGEQSENGTNEVMNPYGNVGALKSSKLDIYKALHYHIQQFVKIMKNRRM